VWSLTRGASRVRCRSCGDENRDSVYCGQCRAALMRPCRVCGEPAPVDAAVCPACGASLAAAARPAAAPRSNAPVKPAPVYRPSPPSSTAPAAGRPRSAQDEGIQFTGVVRDLQQRDEVAVNEKMKVWSFRIERHDASGNRLAPVPVEMWGLSFSGSVSNGDDVRVEGRWRGGTLRVEDLDNLTTGAEVRAKDYQGLRAVVNTIGCTIGLIIFAIIVCIFAFVAWQIIQHPPM
jgi:hypothetical protein